MTNATQHPIRRRAASRRAPVFVAVDKQLDYFEKFAQPEDLAIARKLRSDLAALEDKYASESPAPASAGAEEGSAA